jgi:cell shape-determining protein MreC
MSILYFALGMLSMLGLIFVGIIIWGMVKVVKIQKKIHVIEQLDRDRFDGVYRSFDDIRNDNRREFENVFRRFEVIETNSRLNTNELVRSMDEKLNKMEQHEIKRFDELLNIISDRYDDSIRYTDKRIDKSLNNAYSSPPKQVI